MIRQKVRLELVAKNSEEAHKGEDAAHKLGRLSAAIGQFESMYDVRYRPDKPDFKVMVEEAEDFARKILATEVERKIQSGEINASDWIV